MKADIKELLHTELEYIYTNILSGSLDDNDGVYWIADNGDNSSKFCESIYSGSSGILLFLIEYYNYIKKQQILDLITPSANWLDNYCRKNPVTNFSFYTGRVGTVYTLIKAYEVTNNKPAIENALSLLDDLSNSFNRKDICYDFLNGISGSLLGLVHIYDIVKKDSIKKMIISLTNILIENINVREYGFFWDKTGKMSKPLCGFSHGPSGIAFVFLELGYYFNNDFFYEIAKKAIEYEDHFFSSTYCNWPDFRKGFYDKDRKDVHISQFISGNYDYFETPVYMTAWCHGSPGIGLTRIKAYEKYRDPKFREKILKSIEGTLNSIKAPFYSATLCHGLLGNSGLFLEFYKQTNESKYIQYFVNSCFKAIQLKNKHGFYRSGVNSSNAESLNLFLGIAGIGYSFLQALVPNRIFAPLSPSINSLSEEKLEEFNINYSIQENCKKRFPYTFSLIENIPALEEFNLIALKDVKLNNLLENNIRKDSEPEFAYHLEIKKGELENKMRSYSLLNIQKIQNNNTLVKALKLNFDNSILSLNPEVYFYIEKKKIVLLYPDVTEYKMIQINEQTRLLLKEFETPIKLEHLYSKYKTYDINIILRLKEDLVTFLIKLIKFNIILIKDE